MKHTMYLLAVVFWLATTAAYQKGCSGKSAADGPPRPATEVRSVDFLQKKLQQRQSEMKDIQSLTARAKVFTEGDGMAISASANIIWIRDSVIWMNAKKFGLEALRVLVTKDSVFVLNRLEKSYTADGLETLRRQFALPEGDVFELMQNTLLGLPALPFKSGDTKSDISQELHRLVANLGAFSGEYRIEEGSFLLKGETFIKKSDNTTVRLDFDRHQKVPQMTGLFSLHRRVNAVSPEQGRMGADIELDDVQVNTQPSYKFEIPDHYSKN
jgi:hypothetical protein